MSGASLCKGQNSHFSIFYYMQLYCKIKYIQETTLRRNPFSSLHHKNKLNIEENIYFLVLSLLLFLEFQTKTMAKHHSDLVFCRKLPGIAIGRLCEKCDGKCVICDSYVRPHVLVRICDECNYGSFEVISKRSFHSLD